jgi:predicted DsbA family dithiol-disulfide isomerase
MTWERSQRLDAQVAGAGEEVGIEIRHDLMKRTPNTFKGHVLLAAALREGLQIQNRVAERLFQAYFIKGEDVGDPATLLGIAREFGVTSLSRVEDFESPALIKQNSRCQTCQRPAYNCRSVHLPLPSDHTTAILTMSSRSQDLSD